MAYTTIALSNGIEIKTAPVGYSWTTLFFSGIPALIRQDWIWGIALIIGNMFTWGIVGIVASFFYNKIYIKSLFNKGYKLHAAPNISDEELKMYLGYIKLPGRD